MEHTPCWIWYPGDFELRHSLKLHARRQERDYYRLAIWPVYDCWHSVRFFRRAELTAPEGLTVLARGKGNVGVDGKLYPFGKEIPLSAGTHEIVVEVFREDGLPCLYVEKGSLSGTEGWTAQPFAGEKLPVGFSPLFTLPEQDPEVFPFVYEKLQPVEVIQDERGTLYDFGRETFARVFLEMENQPELTVCFGESETEARAVSDCPLIETVPAGTASIQFPARAFRYVFVPGQAKLCLRVEYERTPLKRRGRFSCSDRLLTDIWNTAAYTFELNSREFFLDGIKRDRWVWSGDAYQSYFVSRFLYMDADICHRTMWALRGKDPLLQHLNSIVDYSLYWLLSIREDYQTYGDLDFVRAIWPRLRSLTDFCLERTNEEGFLIGREEDWIFMDWADMDKDGPLCAEQMLFIRALEAAADCASLAGQDGSRYAAHAEMLSKKLDKFFYDEEKGAYIDTYASGRRNVTRHANIFAILYDFADESKRASIVRNVLGAEDEHTDDVLLDLQQNLSDMIDEYAETHDDDEDVFLLDKEVVTKLLADSEISEEKAAKIEKSVDEAFGEKPPAAENVIDSKALVQNELRVEKMALEDQVGTLTVQLNEKDEALAERTSQLIEKQEEIDNYIAETKTYDVVLRVKPEKASQIKSQVINGQKCLVIPMDEDEHATINGVNIICWKKFK